MAGDKINPAPPAEKTAAAADKQDRERSTIEFPYGDLDDAVEIARAIHEHAGTSCSPDQLAGFLRQTTTSGAFRTKVGSARIFGVIDTERGTVMLTQLGRQIVDQSQERDARAVAFLAVPLYRAVFDKFKGHLLPPRAALEREMAGFGVSRKQADRARQAFERSAEQAGFFAHGTDRLIMPTGLSRPETVPLDKGGGHTREDRGGTGYGNGGGPPLHPFIQGLLQKLPPPDSEWPLTARAKWLQTAANIFDLMYSTGEEIGTIDIKCETL